MSRRQQRPAQDSAFTRMLCIGLTLSFVLLFLLLPVATILWEATRAGLGRYFATLWSMPGWTSIRLTLLVALAVVPLNTLFGIAAAWLITHFHFPAKALLITLIELPLWISPVVGGLVFALVCGNNGWLGPVLAEINAVDYHQILGTSGPFGALAEWLNTHRLQILFAYPGIVLATAFITFPFVARGLIPLMQALGSAEEEAALTLGATGWQLFWRVTFPKIKWGLVYGVILCNARTMGEFGAVSVVSGNIEGETNTMPLQIAQYFDGHDLPAAFILASVLLGLGLVTLGGKLALEWTYLAPDRRKGAV